MNPLDLPGPQFLLLFLVLFGVLYGLAELLRRWLAGPADAPRFEGLALEPYEVAYLSGGEAGVVEAAAARLVHAGEVEVESIARRFKRAQAPWPRNATSMERTLLTTLTAEDRDSRVALDAGRAAAAASLEGIRLRLENLGLILTREQNLRVRLVPALLFLLLPLFGFLKTLVGLSRGKPVLFLVLLCAGALAAAAFGLGRSALRTGRGEVALAELASAHAALKTQAGSRPSALVGDDVILSAALFGVGIFTSGPLAGLAGMAAVKRASGNEGSDTFASFFSSCGSSSGSSCGGGCGGGCGGCGG